MRDKGAGVMLLVDTTAIRQSWSQETLSGADFSYGWLNTLDQEFGFFDIQDVNQVDSVSLADRQIVVCSESALEGLSKTPVGLNLIHEFVSAGGIVALDHPGAEVISLFNLELAENENKRQRLSASELSLILGDRRRESYSNPLPDSLSVFSTLQSYRNTDASSSTENQSNYCFDYIRYGSGGILLTKWDFGRWVTLIQQGRPDENLSAENRYSEFGHSDKLETNDLVAESSYLNSPYPWVDIIEKTLGNFLAGVALAPRWHTAPGASSGIFMMTHDDEGLGDAGAWMNSYEHQRGYRSTSFLMLSEKLTAEGVQSVIANGGEIGLHWNRFDREDKAALETLGVSRWRPFVRQRNLSSQIAWLDSLGVEVSYNRNHYFLWDQDPYRLFRALNASGITMDYSYGPDLRDKGYLFGCAFPFHPLDNNGASFRLSETPVTWTENFAGADSAWIRSIFAENAAQFHGVINALYHNNTFAWAPDYSIYESWRLSYELAQNSRHAMLTASELERFIEARSSSVINWQLDSEGVEVYCHATQSDMALVVPLTELYRPTVSIHDASMNPNELSIRIDSVSILGSLHWRIALPRGKYLLSFEHNTAGGGAGR
jgi:hypothetical protein